ncbi:MFS transporter [Streptomyces sp. NPDC052301]|uniref:MFS transporter n=1 Tax=Streptomyces sp. NPDC052301 TaxID=3365687 RepID=UPI0037D439C6
MNQRPDTLRRARASKSLNVLYVGSFLGNFDRIVITPLLLPAAKGLHVSVGSVTAALTAYLLLFGVMQPVHGLISDTVGRVRVMQGALLGMCVADLVSGLAPSLWVLILGRALAGASAAALLPVAVAYVGDRVPFAQRQRTVATVLAAGAVGTAGATVVAGVVTHLWSWRGAILLVAVAAPVLAVVTGWLPEASVPAVGATSVAGRIRRVFAIGWFRFLVVFALVEGAAMLGFFNFFNAALQSGGKSVLLAGLVTGSYGLAAVVGGVAVRMAGRRVSAAALFGTGGAVLFLGYVACALSRSMAGVLVGSVGAGLAFALAQSIVQTWATEVAEPEDRGVATSLVACAVFTGAAVSTYLVSGLANKTHFGLLFTVAALVTAPVAIVGPVARARFSTALARQRAASGKADSPLPAGRNEGN